MLSLPCISYSCVIPPSSRAYKRDTTNIPTSYKDLVPFFHTCLSYASLAQPLLVFLDSLDQLSNDDFGRNLKWLRPGDQLPANVRLVVSTLPGECLRVLEAFLPSACLVEVHPLSQHDGPAALDSMLAEHARTYVWTCLPSSSSIYWTGPFPGVKSPIEACALGGGGIGAVHALLKQSI